MDTTLSITKVFNANVAAVYNAWIDPEQLSAWMGPVEMRSTVHSIDARVGGAYRIGMTGKDGNEYVVGGIYKEVSPPHKLVMTWQWEEGAMGETAASLVTVTFKEVSGKTEMTLVHERLANAQSRDNHLQGWTSSLSKFEKLVV